MRKIINFVKEWFAGEWNIQKSIITAGVAFGVLFGIVSLFALSIHFLKILGSVLILSAAIGAIKRVKKGFAGEDKVNNIILIAFFAVMAIIGGYLLFA